MTVPLSSACPDSTKSYIQHDKAGHASGLTKGAHHVLGEMGTAYERMLAGPKTAFRKTSDRSSPAPICGVQAAFPLR